MSVYNILRTALASKAIDLTSDAFKMAIVKATYTFDADHNDFSDDISAYELNDAAGYPAGGVALSGLTLTEDAGADLTTWSFGDVTFPISGAGASAVNAVVIYHVTTDYPCIYATIASHAPTGNNIKIHPSSDGGLTLA